MNNSKNNKDAKLPILGTTHDLVNCFLVTAFPQFNENPSQLLGNSADRNREREHIVLVLPLYRGNG